MGIRAGQNALIKCASELLLLKVLHKPLDATFEASPRRTNASSSVSCVAAGIRSLRTTLCIYTMPKSSWRSVTSYPRRCLGRC